MSAIPLNIKDSIENSKIELYLYDSLLFNIKEHNDNRWFNEIESKQSCRASIFLETLKNSGKVFKLKDKDIKANELNGFLSFKEIREFIADNYKQHSHIIDAAASNELSQLKSVLYGYNIVQESKFNQTKISVAGMDMYVDSMYNIRLSGSLYNEAKNIHLSYEKAEQDGIYKSVYEELSKQKVYDITEHLISKSDEFKKYANNTALNQKSDREKQMWIASSSQTLIVKEILKKVSIIIECENINVKYEIIYDIFFQAAHSKANVIDIISASLTKEDTKYLKENK